MTTSLERTLGQRELTLIAIGIVIGSGIFLVPGIALRQSGGYAGVALLVWLVGGILSLLGALTYGELGAMNPRAGGLYVFLRDAFGPLTAFLYGWAFFVVIACGSAAALAVAATAYLDELVPLGPVGEKITILALLASVTVINVRGTRHSALVQNWTTAIKVAVILVMSVVLLLAGTGLAERGKVAFWPETMSFSLLSGAGVAMIGVLWAYEGWQYLTFSAGEARDPQRIFARGMVLGTAVLVVLYVLANMAYVAALGPEGVSLSDRVAADAVGALVGPAGAKLIAVVILVSIFSASNAIALTAPRVYFAMAQDKLFFRRLGEVHPRFGTPAPAIITGSAWAAVLALSGTFEQLLTYVIFAGWIFYALAAVAVFVFRRRQPDAERPFRVPGYPVTPILFVLSAVAIVLNTVYTQPLRAAIGTAFVLSGIPAYYFWRWKGRDA